MKTIIAICYFSFQSSLLSIEEIEPYVRRKRVNPGKSNKLQGLNEEVPIIFSQNFDLVFQKFA